MTTISSTNCPFCRIATTYPPPLDSSISPIPSIDHDPNLISPQCHLIISTPLVIAFLDIMPISAGHLLLVPREHAEKLSDLSGSTHIEDFAPKLWQSPIESFKSAEKMYDEGPIAAHALGYWLPILSHALRSALDFDDWNVVQNNGALAAQVVEHVHFHLIPRYKPGRQEAGRNGAVDVGMLKSWRMFGKGSREDLDDDDGQKIAESIRQHLRLELTNTASSQSRSKL